MALRPPDAHVYRFGLFELDSISGELRRHGLKVRLPDQSLQILKLLLARAGEVIAREELRRALWTENTFVGFEVGLNSAVRKLREALDDSADNPRFIDTVPRRGYRFIASVTGPSVDSTPSTRSDEQPSVQLPPAAAEQVSRPLAPALSVPSAVEAARSGLPRSLGAALLLVVLVLAVGVAYTRGGLPSVRAVPAAEPMQSFVVLPFENLTGDAGQEYFVESVTDAVTAHLSQINGVDVISRTSARQYKETGKRLPQIGTELNVGGVVEGTVARSGSGVRITVTLVRAATDRNVWARVYENDASSILALQQQIASDIAAAAGRPQPVARPTSHAVNPKAYDAYIKGLAVQSHQRHDAFRTAVAYYEEAIAIQPDFGEAYAALALVQVQFLFGGPFSPHHVIPKAEAAARKAVQLDETLARAHWALGQILGLYYWQWDDSARELERAAELQGGREELSAALSESLIRQGRFGDAIAAAERGRSLDPLSVNAQVAVGAAYRATGQHGRAVDELRRALAMRPGNPRVQFQLGATFAMMGRMDDAIGQLQLAARPAQGHNSRIEAYLGYAYAAAGRTRDARAVLQELESHRADQYVSWFGIGLIHDALGERAPALAALQRALEDRAVEFGRMGQYPPFKTIASEPGFKAVMQQVGLSR